MHISHISCRPQKVRRTLGVRRTYRLWSVGV
ncbi:MAG: phage DNA packaging protein J [Bacteroidales bacterium]|nr:phage DNA packaging protein J [Candidatus Equimonas enterica]